MTSSPWYRTCSVSIPRAAWSWSAPGHWLARGGAPSVEHDGREAFILLGVGNAHGSAPGAGLVKIGGYVGILTALAAWYASFAQVVNSTFARTVAPIGPLTA